MNVGGGRRGRRMGKEKMGAFHQPCVRVGGEEKWRKANGEKNQKKKTRKEKEKEEMG